MNPTKIVMGLIFFSVTFAGGLFWITRFPRDITLAEQQNYAANSGRRDPAAIRKTYDFSELVGEDLSTATKKRLMNGFEVIHQGQDVGVRLGHFVLRAQNGGKEFACDHFSQVILSFTGEGVAVSGDKPTMAVEGLCLFDHDVNLTSPLWIPVARISGETPQDREFDFSNEREKVKVSFAHLPGEWPAQWVLTQVKMRTTEGEEVVIDSQELKTMNQRPIVIDLFHQ